jgi:hypothetical protein
MVDYRGVDRDDVARSIRAAVEFMDAHPVGPETTNMFQSLFTVDETTGLSHIQRIENAQTQAELVHALRYAGMQYKFPYFREYFTFHAAQDTDGQGRAVMRDLVAWGVFSGVLLGVYSTTFEEQERYLALNYAQHTVVTGEGIEKLHSHINATAATPADAAAACEAAERIVMISAARAAEDHKPLSRIFNRLSIQQRQLVQSALKQMMPVADATWQQGNPMDTYGLVIPGMTGQSFIPQDPEVRALCVKVADVLRQLSQLDEVIEDMSGVGAACRDSSKSLSGFCFTGTRRAVGEMQAAFPDLQVVYYLTGQPVAPPPPAPPASKPLKTGI